LANINFPDGPGQGPDEADFDIDKLMDQLISGEPEVEYVNSYLEEGNEEVLMTPKIVPEPEEAGFIDPSRISNAEEKVTEEYQLEVEDAEFLGAELLDIIKEQLPDDVILDRPRFLGANREAIGENGSVILGSSFVLNDEDPVKEETHYLPDPSVFEPQESEEDIQAQAERDKSPEVIYEVEDADPDNPDAPQRVRQRAPQMSGNNRAVATLATMSGNIEEVFEPVDTHARVILVDKGRTVEVQVVFGSATEVPDSVVDRLLATSPVESLELPTETGAGQVKETAEQMFNRLLAEGKHSREAVGELLDAGFPEEEVLPLVKAGSKRRGPAPTPTADQDTGYSSKDFPIEEVKHPFSFGRVKLDQWVDDYLRKQDSYFPGATPIIRNISRVDEGSNVLSISIEMPENEHGTEVHRLIIAPTLVEGRITFDVRNTEVLDIAEYIEQRRQETGRA
jgi:hypothetical protein